ncbi:Cell wall / vacuolar inhibitor of fructosidase 1 [Glycine soja]|uniref:Cell wall / vacuolar inhibitor of fructosidase 1 n=1 Tax=Glycine soja TaxID=3848 RepID=A0A445F047_GLYSO|nr:Cell wall / vacuolar inhibitor of fructosidase 1 [Glycine soja]
MLNLKHLSIICSILVVAIISMSACHCRVLQPNDLKLIEETCKRTPNPNLCLQLLKADPRAPSADIAGLALILVDVIKAKATEAEKTIKQLLKQGGNKKALSECADDYDGILKLDVPTATRAVRGNPKFAENAVSDCAVEADSCENGFHGKSPLTHVNNGIFCVSVIIKDSLTTVLKVTRLCPWKSWDRLLKNKEKVEEDTEAAIFYSKKLPFLSDFYVKRSLLQQIFNVHSLNKKNTKTAQRMPSELSTDSTKTSTSSDSSTTTSKIEYPTHTNPLILQFTAVFHNDMDIIEVPTFYHQQWAPKYPEFVNFRYDGTIYQIRLRQHREKRLPNCAMTHVNACGQHMTILRRFGPPLQWNVVVVDGGVRRRYVVQPWYQFLADNDFSHGDEVSIY